MRSVARRRCTDEVFFVVRRFLIGLTMGLPIGTGRRAGSGLVAH